MVPMYMCGEQEARGKYILFVVLPHGGRRQEESDQASLFHGRAPRFILSMEISDDLLFDFDAMSTGCHVNP